MAMTVCILVSWKSKVNANLLAERRIGPFRLTFTTAKMLSGKSTDCVVFGQSRALSTSSLPHYEDVMRLANLKGLLCSKFQARKQLFLIFVN